MARPLDHRREQVRCRCIFNFYYTEAQILAPLPTDRVKPLFTSQSLHDNFRSPGTKAICWGYLFDKHSQAAPVVQCLAPRKARFSFCKSQPRLPGGSAELVCRSSRIKTVSLIRYSMFKKTSCTQHTLIFSGYI